MDINGTDLHTKVVDHGHPVWLIVTHGIGEHSGRHHYLIDLLKDQFNLFFYDLRGHGRSQGRRAYVNRFSLYYQDLEEIIVMLSRQHAMKRFVLFGHSMGGAITCGYLQGSKSDTPYPEKVFLSSPAVGAGGPLATAVEHLPKGLFSKAALFPFSVELAGFVNLGHLSHDPEVKEAFKNDDLCCLKIHSKLLLELVAATKTIFSRPLRLKAPTYCAYGTEDRIINVKAIKDYFQRVERSVTLYPIEGGWHELHLEQENYRSLYFQFLKDSLGLPSEH